MARVFGLIMYLEKRKLFSRLNIQYIHVVRFRGLHFGRKLWN